MNTLLSTYSNLLLLSYIYEIQSLLSLLNSKGLNRPNENINYLLNIFICISLVMFVNIPLLINLVGCSIFIF